MPRIPNFTISQTSKTLSIVYVAIETSRLVCCFLVKLPGSLVSRALVEPPFSYSILI